MTADSVVKAGLFGTSSEDQVIVGTDGWLYFAKTMDDYWGRNVLDDRDIARLARTVELMREYAQGQGAAFAFAVVPNKNTVYPEHMPYYTLKTPDPTNRERLAAVIGARPYVTDLAAALRAPGETLYHKRDSHWNALGALAGYNAVMDTLGLPHEDYADTPRSVRRIWDGDLDAMLDPGLGRKDDQVVLDTAWRYRYTSAFRSEEDITITTENDGGTGRLLMFRDSFGNAALPFFAQAFREAEFSPRCAVPAGSGGQGGRTRWWWRSWSAVSRSADARAGDARAPAGAADGRCGGRGRGPAYRDADGLRVSPRVRRGG